MLGLNSMTWPQFTALWGSTDWTTANATPWITTDSIYSIFVEATQSYTSNDKTAADAYLTCLNADLWTRTRAATAFKTTQRAADYLTTLITQKERL